MKDDVISRKSAIDLLDNLIGMVDDNHGSDYDAALRMGIDALRAKPISARRMYQIGYDDGKKDASAQPRMKGRWIKQIDESINAWWYECSVCGDYPLKNAFGYDSLSQFCPWCGAELSEGEESHEDIPEGTL